MKKNSMPHDHRWYTSPYLWWMVPVFWGTLILASYTWRYHSIKADAFEMAALRGRQVFSMIQVAREWNASHGGIYAEITPMSPVNPYLKHPDKFAKTTKGKQLTLINPAYMTRQMNEILATEADLKCHLTSLHPINPINKADAWETEALQAFETGVKERVGFYRENNMTTFRYMAVMPVKEVCLQCHAQQGYKIGQIRGGLSVTQPASYVTNMIDSQMAQVLIVHVTAFVLLTLITLLGLWQNRRQFLRLEQSRDYSVKIAEELVQKMQELEQTRDQLLQSEKMATVGQLAAGVAHEINNPIGFVNSNLYTLEKYAGNINRILATYAQAEASFDADTLAALQVAKREVDLAFVLEDIQLLLNESQEGLARVKRIVQDLRDFSRAEASAWQSVSLEQCIESTLSVVGSEVKAKADFVKEYAVGLPEVDCMPALLNQVLMSLLVNAAQAIEKKGVITLRTGMQGDEVWIEVADTGVGIEPQLLSKIFDPFFTTKPVGTGTGLGLSVAYGFVQKHGGRIEVQSEFGHGTVMRVVLPIKHVE